MSVRIKICGITRLDDALAAIDAGADALGFVFAESKRRISPVDAARIVSALPPFVTTVGLVVDQPIGPILDVCPVDVVQFHGSEPPEVVAASRCRAIRAFRVRDPRDLAELDRFHPSAHLLDAFVPGSPGGTGQSFPWELAVQAARPGRRIIVAGGLRPENVSDCIRSVRPYGVDVSSGVETDGPGLKDPKLMRSFCAAVREAVTAVGS